MQDGLFFPFVTDYASFYARAERGYTEVAAWLSLFIREGSQPSQ